MSKKLIYLMAIHSECSAFALSITEVLDLNTEYDLGGGLKNCR